MKFWIEALSVTGCLFLTLACSSQESFLTAAAGSKSEVVAVLDGEQIRDEDLDITIELMKLEQDMYQVRREALEQSIALRLLENRNGVEPSVYFYRYIPTKN